jgi:fatty acid desaturase
MIDDTRADYSQKRRRARAAVFVTVGVAMSVLCAAAYFDFSLSSLARTLAIVWLTCAWARLIIWGLERE